MDAVLTVFANAGIPVMDGLQTVAGPVADLGAVPWWVVHQLSAADPATSTPLPDVVAMAVTGANGPVVAPDAASTALTGDLEGAITGDDANAAFLATFISEDSLLHGGSGLPLNSPTDASDLRAGPVAAMLTEALIARVGAHAAGSAAAAYDKANGVPPPAEVEEEWPYPPAMPPADCVFPGEDGDKMWWVKWLTSKAYLGTPVPGRLAEFKGLWGLIFDKFKHVGAIFNALDWLAANLTVTVLAATILALDVSLTTDNNETLERTTSKSDDGKSTHVHARVFYNFGTEDNVDDLNCLLLMASLLGFDFQDTLPKNGAVPGIEVTVEGRHGFADRLNTANAWVMFGPDKFSPRMDTDENGEISIPVQGRRQTRTVSHDAPFMREFSLGLEAQPSQVTATSIANAFLESLSAWVGGGIPGFVKAAANVIATVHFNLGKVDEHVLPIRDFCGSVTETNCAYWQGMITYTISTSTREKITDGTVTKVSVARHQWLLQPDASGHTEWMGSQATSNAEVLTYKDCRSEDVTTSRSSGDGPSYTRFQPDNPLHPTKYRIFTGQWGSEPPPPVRDGTVTHLRRQSSCSGEDVDITTRRDFDQGAITFDAPVNEKDPTQLVGSAKVYNGTVTWNLWR